MKRKTCKAHGCDVEIRDGHYFCRHHWQLLCPGIRYSITLAIFERQVQVSKGGSVNCYVRDGVKYLKAVYGSEALGDRSDSPATHTPPESASQ